MPIQIGQPAGHSFNEPLGLLSDCHRRIEHFLHVLFVVATEGAGPTLTADHRAALEASLNYFAVAAPKHTADEEVSLFPRLRKSDAPAAADAMASLETLEQDHDEAEAHHAAVDALVRRWLADDRLSAEDAADLHERLTQLQTLYRRHIAVEDQEIFPVASRVLHRTDIEQIGREMAARRKPHFDNQS